MFFLLAGPSFVYFRSSSAKCLPSHALSRTYARLSRLHVPLTHFRAARQTAVRALSSMSAAEQRIYDKLVSHFNASKVVVEDQSGNVACSSAQ